MREEDDHWQTCFTDFQNSPVNGIRGKGMHRKDEYIAQDENLRQIFQTRNNRAPFDYLLSIAQRMAEPQ